MRPSLFQTKTPPFMPLTDDSNHADVVNLKQKMKTLHQNAEEILQKHRTTVQHYKEVALLSQRIDIGRPIESSNDGSAEENRRFDEDEVTRCKKMKTMLSAIENLKNALLNESVARILCRQQHHALEEALTQVANQVNIDDQSTESGISVLSLRDAFENNPVLSDIADANAAQTVIDLNNLITTAQGIQSRLRALWQPVDSSTIDQDDYILPGIEGDQVLTESQESAIASINGRMFSLMMDSGFTRDRDNGWALTPELHEELEELFGCPKRQNGGSIAQLRKIFFIKLVTEQANIFPNRKNPISIINLCPDGLYQDFICNHSKLDFSNSLSNLERQELFAELDDLIDHSRQGKDNSRQSSTRLDYSNRLASLVDCKQRLLKEERQLGYIRAPSASACAKRLTSVCGRHSSLIMRLLSTIISCFVTIPTHSEKRLNKLADKMMRANSTPGKTGADFSPVRLDLNRCSIITGH